MVPQSPHSGSASTLAVLATFYNSVSVPNFSFLACLEVADRLGKLG